MNEFILFENRVSDQQKKDKLFFFNKVDEIICHRGTELEHCFERIATLQQQGYYLAGFVSYEAGYHLSPFIFPDLTHENVFPLLHFNAFKSLEYLSNSEVEKNVLSLAPAGYATCKIHNLRFNLSKEEYSETFEKIKRYIFHGHTYQVNLSGKYLFDFEGSPIHLYNQLRERQRVPYSSLLNFEAYQILSLSPELFFSKSSETVVVKPMKGTMPRSCHDEEDIKNKMYLITDEKSIAENLMIVDLLRNDLNRVSYPGTVKIERLMEVTSYETVHQMTSTITSRINSRMGLKELITGLFPCGSVTGVPKYRTMQIIQELEKEPRKIFTGAIGYITPDNDMCFNVPIRTLLLNNKKGELGVGSGIVNDSNANHEYDEMQWKAAFFTSMDGLNNE